MTEHQTIEWKSSWQDDQLKVLCGFANAQGGCLVLGRDDAGHARELPDAKRLLEELPQKIPQILGISPSINLVLADGRDTIEIRVESSTVPVSLRGRYYYRSGSVTKELTGAALNEFLLRKCGLTWDAVIEERASFDDIDPAAITRFLGDARKTERMPGADELALPVLMEKLGLAETGRLKRGAIILFGKDPLRFYPGVSVRLGRFVQDDTDLRFHEIIEDNLVNSLPEILERLDRKFFVKAIRFEGIHRYETPPYPREALREAFLNAMVHKSYGSGVHIQCRVYDDRLTLWNEGALPDDLPAEALLRSHASKPRNPLIATACFKAGYIDAWGRGIEKMTRACAEASLPPPTFEANSGGVLATFSHALKAAPHVTPEVTPEVAPEVAPEVIKMLGLLRGAMTRGEIMSILGLRDEKHFREHYQQVASNFGLIEMTIPEKPKSPLQKYRLTAKGRALLEKSTHTT